MTHSTPDEPESSSVDPLMIDAYTSAVLAGAAANPEIWLLQHARDQTFGPSALTTFRTLDLLVRNRNAIGGLWQSPLSIDRTPSITDEYRTASTPVMSDPTAPSGLAGDQMIGHLEDRAWLNAHQLEPLGFLDVRGGGMGEIALAWHSVMNKEVVLKVANKPHLQERFQREIEIHARIEGHAHIVVSRTPLRHRGSSILVVDYVRGLSLRRWLELHEKMKWPLAAECVRQVALGLGHAHAQGVIHRDIKPSNLILSSRDSVVKILDWGLALDRERKEHGQMTLTGTGQMLGTPLYCSPEQAETPSDVTPASDLYALGCVWYELMTGKSLFPAARKTLESLDRLKKSHANDPVPALPEELEVPEPVEKVMRKLLDKNPEQRYPSAEAFIAALDQARLGDRAVPVGPWRPWMTWASVAGLILVVWLGWPKPPGKLRVRQFVIKVNDPRGRPAFTGKLGSDLYEASWRGEVTTESELTEPAYTYLIAFLPDGKMQLCSGSGPAGEDAVPGRVQSISYPPLDNQRLVFRLNDGQGLQAFALVVSKAPLPSFREWKAAQGPCPWRAVQDIEPGLVWRYKDKKIEFAKDAGSEKVRGVEETSEGARRAVLELAGWLEKRPGVEEVVIEAFTVLPPDTDQPKTSTPGGK